jgi:hypothetical protein
MRRSMRGCIELPWAIYFDCTVIGMSGSFRNDLSEALVRILHFCIYFMYLHCRLILHDSKERSSSISVYAFPKSTVYLPICRKILSGYPEQHFSFGSTHSVEELSALYRACTVQKTWSPRQFFYFS